MSRRLGLLSLPLACVVIRMVSKALLAGPLAFRSLSGVLIWLAVFLCLSAFKALLSLLLMVYACRSGRLEDASPLRQAPPPPPPKSPRASVTSMR